MPTEFNLRLNADSTGLIKNVGKAVRSIAELEGTSSRTTRRMGSAFKGLAIIASAGLGLDTIQRYGDMLVDTTNRLALLTDSTSELNSTMDALLETSIKTRTGFEGTAIVYSRVALALRDSSASTQEMISFTETLNKAIILSGTKSVEAGQALIQLSQGMASGALRGDELRSVMEQLPFVADLIADKMGVFRASLRLLGREGKITTDIVRDSVTEAKEEVDKAFARTQVSVAQATNVLETQFLKSFRTLNDVIPLVDMLSKSILFLANNAGVLGRALVTLTATMTVMNIYNVLIKPTILATKAVKGLRDGVVGLHVAMQADKLGYFGSIVYKSLILPFEESGKRVAVLTKRLKKLSGMGDSLKAQAAIGSAQQTSLATKHRGLMRRRDKLRPASVSSSLLSGQAKALKDELKAKKALEKVNTSLAASLATWNSKLEKGVKLTPRHSKNIQRLYAEKKKLSDQLKRATGDVIYYANAMNIASNVAGKEYKNNLKNLTKEIDDNQTAMLGAAAGASAVQAKQEQLGKTQKKVEGQIVKAGIAGGVLGNAFNMVKNSVVGLIAKLAGLAKFTGVIVTLGAAGGLLATVIGSVVIAVTTLLAGILILSSKFKLMTTVLDNGTKKTFSLLDGFIALFKVVTENLVIFDSFKNLIKFIREGFTNLSNDTNLWMSFLAQLITVVMAGAKAFNLLTLSVIGTWKVFTFQWKDAVEVTKKFQKEIEDLIRVFSGEVTFDVLDQMQQKMEESTLKSDFDALTKTIGELENAMEKTFNKETSFLNKEQLALFELKKELRTLFSKGSVTKGMLNDSKAIEHLLKDMGDSSLFVIETLQKLKKEGNLTIDSLVNALAEGTMANKKLAESTKEVLKIFSDINTLPINTLIDQLNLLYSSLPLSVDKVDLFKSFDKQMKEASDATFNMLKPIEALKTPLQEAKKEMESLFESEYITEAKNQLIDFAEDALKDELFQAIKDGNPPTQELLDKIKSFNKENIDPSQVKELADTLEKTAKMEFFKGLVDAKTALEDIFDIVEANNSGMARTAAQQEKINKAYTDAVETRYDELIPEKSLQQSLQERLDLTRMTSMEQEAFNLAKEEQDRLNRKSLEDIVGLTGEELDARLKSLNANKAQLAELQSQSMEYLRHISYEERIARLREQAMSAQFVESDLKEAINVYKQIMDGLNEDSGAFRVLSSELEAMEQQLLRLGPASNGIELGLRQVREGTKLTADSVANELVNAFGHAEDAMVDFFMTGKIGFKEMINSMISDLIRFMTQKFIINTITGSFINSSPTNAPLPEMNLGQELTVPNKASGGITSGGLTMVGERGPELAALPKNTRIMSYMDTMNALGAASSSGSGAAPINVTVNQNIESSGKGQGADQDMLDKIAAQTQKAVKESIRSELKEQRRPRNMLNQGMTM